MELPLALRTDETYLLALPLGHALAELQVVEPDQLVRPVLERVAGDVATDIRTAVTPVADIRLLPASYGRGAEVLGVAVQLLMDVGAVYGGVAALLDASVKVRAAYEAIRRRFGRRPLVSLGTARALAAAEVATKLGHDDFQLVGSGDVNSTPADRSFTGEDAFWVTFLEQVAVLHQCLVESDGRVHYMGAITMHDNWLSRHRLLSGERSVLPETDDEGLPDP